MNDLNDYQTMAKAIFKSGFFADCKSVDQVLVKILIGAELGLPPMASVAGIHILHGKPSLSANAIATLVQNDPRYSYRIKTLDDNGAILTWYENGQEVGNASFTYQEASAANLTNKATWKMYRQDLLFARAITRGARRFASGIFGGSPVYTPEELGADVDNDGNIVIDTAPQPAAPPPPLIDSHKQIITAPASDFFDICVKYIPRYNDVFPVKQVAKILGYTALPGSADARIGMYEAIALYASCRDDGMDKDDALAAVDAARAGGE